MTIKRTLLCRLHSRAFATAPDPPVAVDRIIICKVQVSEREEPEEYRDRMRLAIVDALKTELDENGRNVFKRYLDPDDVIIISSYVGWASVQRIDVPNTSPKDGNV